MKWIIQEKIFGEESDKLVEAIQNNGTADYSIEKAYEGLRLKEDFMLRGSIEFVKFYQELNDRYLGLTLENYDCSHYYTWFKDYLLNSKCLFMTWDQLNDTDLIFKAWPEVNRFFIRPNSGRKLFTGTTLTKKWWSRELKIISELPSTTWIRTSDLVLVAPAHEILAEYRCVMHYGNLIDYSQYAGDPQPDEYLNIRLFTDLPQSLLWYPDQLYTMDIAATAEGWKILELNSFVSAGLYDIDYDKLVNYVEENL